MAKEEQYVNQVTPTYNEQVQTNYGGGGNPYNELINSKKEYDLGKANGGQGRMDWASNNAQQFYGQLDPNEASLIKGMNTQQLIDYVNGKNSASWIGNGLGGGAQQNKQGGLSDLEGWAKQQADASYNSQQAILERSRNERIAELEMAYNQAVENGELSVKQAQELYEAEVKKVNQNAYDDSQRTNVAASQRGIGNSQQMLGMQASDNARANTLRNESGNTLSSTLSNIKQRMNTIKLNKDLDVQRANTDYDLGLAQARADADARYADQMFGLKSEDYRANRDNQFGIDMFNREANFSREQTQTQYNNQVKLMEKQAGIDINQMKVKLGLDKELQGYINDLDLMKMAHAFGYDLEKMKQSHLYDSALQSARLAAEKSMQTQRLNADKEKQDNYMRDLEREMNKYTPGTPEYNLYQSILKEQDRLSKSNSWNEVQQDINTKKLIESGLDLSKYSSYEEAVAAMYGMPSSTSSSRGSILGMETRPIDKSQSIWENAWRIASNPFGNK